MNNRSVIAFAAAALMLTGCDQPQPVRPVVVKQHIQDDRCLLLGGICLDAVPTFDMR